MNVVRLAASARVRAPAKLNLFFEILAKRGDGYHEIETLMVPVSLYDTLIASPDPSGQIHVSCRWAFPGDGAPPVGELPREADNLATKAALLLQRRWRVGQGLQIELVKRIPAAAGMGGGSSDAAATLLAANLVWNLGLSRAELADLAAELGSDVPFFLAGGPAVCRGRGERVEPLGSLAPIDCVVVRPPEGLSTAAVYANSRVATEPRGVEPLVDALARGDTRRLGQLVHNRLEEAADSLTPWIGRLRREFENTDCLAAALCGSGSAYFGICRHAGHARRVARRLRARGIGWVYAASTSN
jgi:4-diphosphocytidyl-2-C-methyl-D-erythritol kinase